jgi:hypothetical protein
LRNAKSGFFLGSLCDADFGVQSVERAGARSRNDFIGTQREP